MKGSTASTVGPPRKSQRVDSVRGSVAENGEGSVRGSMAKKGPLINTEVSEKLLTK